MVDCEKFDYDKFASSSISSNKELERLGLVWKWFSMDISEDDNNKVCTIGFIFKNSNGSYGSFYLIEDELSVTRRLVDPLILDPHYIIPQKHSQHPYNVFGELKIQRAMLDANFTGGTVIIQ